MTTSYMIFGFLCGVMLLSGCIWILIALHLAYTKMDELLDLLKNSPAIRARASLRTSGPWGNILLIGEISGALTFPGFYLKKGGVSADDLKHFPVTLKRKLILIHWGAIGTLSFALVLWIIGKVVGWHT